MEERDGYFIIATTSTDAVISFSMVEKSPSGIEHRGEAHVRVVECRGDVCVTRVITLQRRAGEEPSYRSVLISVYPTSRGLTLNNVYVVDLSSPRVVGALEGLAPGERVYAARLIKNVLFLVTFRQVDPLFAIDVSDPENPKVLGFLKMPGFSEYLHPLNENRLLGIGRERNALKISLFNVTDPARMSVLSEVKVPSATSPVLSDHKAFTIDSDYHVIYVPIRAWCLETQCSGVLAVSLKNDSLKVLKILEHEGAVRTLYVGNEVFTVSTTSIKYYDASTLEERGVIELKT